MNDDNGIRRFRYKNYKRVLKTGSIYYIYIIIYIYIYINILTFLYSTYILNIGTNVTYYLYIICIIFKYLYVYKEIFYINIILCRPILFLKGFFCAYCISPLMLYQNLCVIRHFEDYFSLS